MKLFFSKVADEIMIASFGWLNGNKLTVEQSQVIFLVWGDVILCYPFSFSSLVFCFTLV